MREQKIAAVHELVSKGELQEHEVKQYVGRKQSRWTHDEKAMLD